MKKYILVTGGAGFIGSYLVDGLIKKGHNVLIVDDLKGDSALFYINPKAEFIKKDATDPFLFQILDRYEIEGVYHLVAHTTTEGSFTNPHLSINTNSYSTWLIANYCRNRKIKRLIYSSTCAVYGDVSEDVINEKTPINPNSTYGSTKYAGELFIKQLFKKHGINKIEINDLNEWNDRHEEILEINNVQVKNSEEKFIFNLESWGQLSCKEILLKALEIFNDKLDDFESKLKKAK